MCPRPVQVKSTLLPVVGPAVSCSWGILSEEANHLLSQPSFDDDVQFLTSWIQGAESGTRGPSITEMPEEDLFEPEPVSATLLDYYHFGSSFASDQGSWSKGLHKASSESEDGGSSKVWPVDKDDPAA